MLPYVLYPHTAETQEFFECLYFNGIIVSAEPCSSPAYKHYLLITTNFDDKKLLPAKLKMFKVTKKRTYQSVTELQQRVLQNVT